MDPDQSSEALDATSLDQISLAQLEDNISSYIRINGHGQQVLQKYMEWLHQQVVKDIFARENTLVSAWIQSLRDRGFEDNIIYSSFKDWKSVVGQEDPSSRRRYLMVDDEIRQILESKQHTPPQPDSHVHSSRSHLIDTNNQSDSALEASPPSSIECSARVGGKKRTGANDTPVVNNKRAKSFHSPGQNVYSEKDLYLVDEEGKREFSKDTTLLPEDRMSSAASEASEQRYIRLRNRTIPIILSPEQLQLESNGSSSKKPSTAKQKQPVNSKLDAKKSKKAQLYRCKRCHESGHLVQECPTNMDPRYDTRPAPNYRCDFCGKLGVHLGTLCPNNNHHWSLTYRRKEYAARRWAKDSGSRNDRRERSPTQLGLPPRQGSDSYRPASSPRARDEKTDRYRPSYRERSLSFSDDTSPIYGARSSRSDTPAPLVRSPPFREPPSFQVTPVRESRRSRKKRNKDRDSYRPRKNDRRSRSPKPDGNYTLRKPDTEGRLSYDDEDQLIQDVHTAPFGVDNIHHSNVPYSSSQEDDPRVSFGTRNLDQEADKPAAVKALDFLHTLSTEMQGDDDDSVEAACASRMDSILSDIVDATETGDSTFTVDPDGLQYRVLTNPPYSESVIRLFPGLAVLIVNPRPRRTTAVDMMCLGGLGDTASVPKLIHESQSG